MSPVLRTLLGQGVGVPAAEQIREGIVVPGKRLPTEQVPGPPVVSPDDTQRMLLERYKGNLDNSDFIRARQEAVRAGEKASDRRGMFGVKGTLRDILGVLGDAFLIQSGNAPIYGPTRRRELISDAMAGGELNPAAARARVGYYSPEMEQQMLEAYENQQLREAQQESLAEARESQIQARELAGFHQTRESIARLLNNPNAYGPDGNLTPEAEAIATRLAEGANRSLEDFDVTPGMSRTRGSLLASTGATVNQQNMLPIAQRNVAAREVSAQAADRNSRRPRSGRAPRAKTDGERFDEFRAIPEGERTRDQQDFIDDYVGRNKGSGGRRRPSSPNATGGLQIRLRRGWSSLAARRAHNPKVIGSNPIPATNLSSLS